MKVRIEARQNGVKIADLKLDPLDFVWNHPTVNTPSNYENGQKGAIVEMFGWPYDEIAKECVMLGKAGYLGVKVFPPQESILDFSNP
jgi:alpha-amylase